MSDLDLIARAKRDAEMRARLELPPAYRREPARSNPAAAAAAARLRWRRHIAAAPERAFPDTAER